MTRLLRLPPQGQNVDFFDSESLEVGRPLDTESPRLGSRDPETGTQKWWHEKTEYPFLLNNLQYFNRRILKHDTQGEPAERPFLWPLWHGISPKTLRRRGLCGVEATTHTDVDKTGSPTKFGTHVKLVLNILLLRRPQLQKVRHRDTRPTLLDVTGVSEPEVSGAPKSTPP